MRMQNTPQHRLREKDVPSSRQPLMKASVEIIENVQCKRRLFAGGSRLGFNPEDRQCQEGWCDKGKLMGTQDHISKVLVE